MRARAARGESRISVDQYMSQSLDKKGIWLPAEDFPNNLNEAVTLYNRALIAAESWQRYRSDYIPGHFLGRPVPPMTFRMSTDYYHAPF